MFNLGLTEELLRNTSIWLCLDCGRCTEACSQLVDGRAIMRFVKQLSIERGIVDHAFFSMLEQANRIVLRRWINEVDALFGFNGRLRSLRAGPESAYATTCADHPLSA